MNLCCIFGLTFNTIWFPFLVVLKHSEYAPSPILQQFFSISDVIMSSNVAGLSWLHSFNSVFIAESILLNCVLFLLSKVEIRGNRTCNVAGCRMWSNRRCAVAYIASTKHVLRKISANYLPPITVKPRPGSFNDSTSRVTDLTFCPNKFQGKKVNKDSS